MKEVLIIEDEADLREALRDALLGAGFAVKAVESSEAGLQQIMAKKPDLVLLDVFTHSLHGAQFMERLSLLPNAQGVCKVVVLTALDNDITKEKMGSYPIEEFLVKTDHSLSEIVEKIKGHLGDDSQTKQNDDPHMIHL